VLSLCCLVLFLFLIFFVVIVKNCRASHHSAFFLPYEGGVAEGQVSGHKVLQGDQV